MKYLKEFESFTSADPDVAPAPTKPKAPARPKPGKPIEKPSTDPAPKAGKKKTELDVANRFIKESNKRGESVKKYLNK